MKYNIVLTKYSHVNDDGNRRLISKEIVCGSDSLGMTNLLYKFLKENTYKDLITPVNANPNADMITLTIENKMILEG